MSNILIVESENDQYFIEALIKNINLEITVDKPICSIDEFECLGGISKLEGKLKSLIHKILKGEVEKIGILFDANSVGVKKREKEIQGKIDLIKDLLKREYQEDCSNIEFKIHILNVDGQGELETLLKRIKSKDSTIADCLDSWQECLPEDKRLKQKDFDKFWVQVYQRYDCCSKKEAKQAGKNCNNEVSLKKKDIWDFEHEILNELKKFLIELGEN